MDASGISAAQTAYTTNSQNAFQQTAADFESLAQTLQANAASSTPSTAPTSAPTATVGNNVNIAV